MTEQQFTQSLLRSNVNFQKERLRHVLGITETFSGLAERPADQYVTLKADHLDCLFEQISESIDGVLNYLDHVSLHIATPDPITPGLNGDDMEDGADTDQSHLHLDTLGNDPVCAGTDMSIDELCDTLKRCTTVARGRLIVELANAFEQRRICTNT